jgi:serine/threonine protein kinase
MHARQQNYASVLLLLQSDLKPENIIYDEKKKNVKIIDFGSGVRFDSNDIKARKRVGTVIIHLFSPTTLLLRS